MGKPFCASSVMAQFFPLDSYTPHPLPLPSGGEGKVASTRNRGEGKFQISLVSFYVSHSPIPLSSLRRGCG